VAASVARQGARIGLAHTVELLDASLRGRSAAELTRGLALAPSLPADGPVGDTTIGKR
jgi:hypothetical protein